MKKIVIGIMFATTFSQIFCSVRTSNPDTAHIEQQAEAADNGSLLSLTPPQFKSITLEFEKIYPSLKTSVNKILGADRLENIRTIIGTIQEEIKDSFRKLSNPLKTLQKQEAMLTVNDLKNLISALNAYAQGKMHGLRLAAPLSDIYSAVRDTYKNLYVTDEKISQTLESVSRGNITTEVVTTSVQHTLADTFLQTLLYSIIQGKFENYLLNNITTSLQLEKPILPLEPAKGTSTAAIAEEKVQEEKTGY